MTWALNISFEHNLERIFQTKTFWLDPVKENNISIKSSFIFRITLREILKKMISHNIISFSWRREFSDVLKTVKPKFYYRKKIYLNKNRILSKQLLIKSSILLNKRSREPNLKKEHKIKIVSINIFSLFSFRMILINHS